MLELLKPCAEGLNEVDADSSNQPAGGKAKRATEAQSHGAKSSSVAPDAGEDTLVKEVTMSVFTHYPKGSHIAKYVNGPNPPVRGVRRTNEAHRWYCAVHEVWRSNHQITKV